MRIEGLGVDGWTGEGVGGWNKEAEINRWQLKTGGNGRSSSVCVCLVVRECCVGWGR